jgi:hypothetical protein
MGKNTDSNRKNNNSFLNIKRKINNRSINNLNLAKNNNKI